MHRVYLGQGQWNKNSSGYVILRGTRGHDLSDRGFEGFVTISWK